jgi:hypothetical protein
MLVMDEEIALFESTCQRIFLLTCNGKSALLAAITSPIAPICAQREESVSMCGRFAYSDDLGLIYIVFGQRQRYDWNSET